MDKHLETALWGKEICEVLGYYTAAMFFLGEDRNFDKAGIGSGVLVKLAERYFMLTAGHCAKDYQSGRTAIGIARNEPHRFTPQISRVSFRLDESRGIDFGYIEVPAIHAGTFSSRSKLFMSLNRILVETAEQLKQDKDRMVVAGYPGEMTQKSTATKHGTHGYDFFYNSTIIAGTGNASPSTIPAPVAGMQTIDLSVAPEAQINTTSGQFEEMQIPRFRGMSGGGCWRSCFVTGANWEPSHMKLVGIHIGSPQDGRFSREVLIGHHLRLIAEDYSDLQTTIYSAWPDLRESH
jgi:hypothetical protein